MGYVAQEVGALIVIDPKKAVAKILKAYRQAGASKRGAAEILACDEHTLARWVKKLFLQKELEKMATKAIKEGWHHDRKRQGGRKAGGKNRPKEKR